MVIIAGCCKKTKSILYANRATQLWRSSCKSMYVHRTKTIVARNTHTSDSRSLAFDATVGPLRNPRWLVAVFEKYIFYL